MSPSSRRPLARGPLTQGTLARLVPLLALLAACGKGDTSFSKDQTDNTNIEGTGQLQLTPSGPLEWSELAPGYPCSKYLRIDSLGVQALVVSRIDITVSGGGVFRLPESHEAIELQQGESYEFRVQAELQTLTEAEGELRIRSNDETEVDLRVPLLGHPVEEWDSGSTEAPPC